MSEIARRIVEQAALPGATVTGIARELGVTTGHVSQTLRLNGIDITSTRPRSKDPRVARRAALRKPKISRPCICCQERFWSEGPHNRMCVRCRHEPSEWPLG